MARRAPVLLRRLASLLIRGPEAVFVRSDLEDAWERDLARGLSATRAGWRYLGNTLGSAIAVARARPWRPTLPFAFLDVKLGLRMLVKAPVLTGVAVFALAVGIPVGMAPWQFAGALEAPFPVDHGERVRLLRYWDALNSHPDEATAWDYLRWRESLASFESIGALRMSGFNVESDDGLGDPVGGAEVTASIFDVVRVPPFLGRTLDPDDERPGAEPVAVIGYDLWRSRFLGDPQIVGRTVSVGGVSHIVVGVMPEGFLFPVRQQLWVPLRAEVSAGPREGQPLMVLGRLSAGVTFEQADAEVAAVGSRFAAEMPELYGDLRGEVVPSAYIAFGFPRGGFRSFPDFWIAQFFSLLLLGVACLNVGMLIFARTVDRSTELAVRTALGASRGRIVAQVFTEALVLATVAAGVGLLLTDWLPDIALSVVGLSGLLPYWVDFGVTSGTALRALALGAFSAGLAGVIPALRVTGRSVHGTIQTSSQGTTGRGFGWISGALIVADIAVAVMVVGAAAGISDVVLGARHEREGVGIAAEEFLSVQFRLPSTELTPDSDAATRRAFATRVGESQRELVRRLASEPGVRGVAVANVLPRMDHPNRLLEIEGEEPLADGRSRRARVAHVDIDFFDGLGAPILAGRGFAPADLQEGAATAIVNTSFVERLLGGRNPIGRRVRYRGHGAVESSRWYTIVGVVGHLGMHLLRPDQDEGLYVPAAPGEIHPARIAIHLGGDPESFVPRLRAIAREVDPLAVVASPMRLDRLYEGDWYLMIGVTAGGGLLIGILLALAASGLYAIMSFTVAQRTREIGIRTALGARRTSIALTVSRRSMTQIALGVLLGLPMAWMGLGELAGSLPGGAGWAAAGTVALGVGAMALIALLGCAAPTLRALRVDPTEALRGE